MNAPQPVNLLKLAIQGAAALFIAPVTVALIAAATGFQTEPKPLTFREKVRDKFNGAKERMNNAFHNAGEKTQTILHEQRDKAHSAINNLRAASNEMKNKAAETLKSPKNETQKMKPKK